MLLDLLWTSRSRLKAILCELWCGLLNADWRRLKGERFGLREGLVLLCVLRAIVLAILCCRVRILTNTTREGRRHGGLEEAGRVRCRLSAKLGKIEVGACSVADIHGLPELALGVEAVEDDCIDGDGYGFHNNFDDTADKRPLLFQKLTSSTILRRREMN